MKLKVFLVFGASIVMTSTAFAVIWEKPIPQTIQITTVKNANDGKAVYLYNSDYKGFYHGAYDYGTRASVGNIGLQVKLVQQPSGKYGIYYVANKDYASPDAADGIWIDGKRANFDGWTITPTEGNYFKLAVPAVLKNGTLGLLSTAQDTRINLIAPEAATNGAQIYDTWAMVAPEEYQSWYAKNEVYLLAVKLGNNINFAKEQFPEIDITAEEAIYNNTSSTKKDIEAAINALPQKFKTAAAASASATNPKDMTAVIINPSFEDGSINGWTAKYSDDTGARENLNATYHVDNADGNYVFNTWSAGYPITQTLTSMPNGVYKLEGMVTSSDDCTNVFLLANGKHETVTLQPNPKTNNKTTYFTTGKIFFSTTDGKVTIGASGSAKDGKSFSPTGEWWYKADNFRLTYYGNKADAWNYALSEYKASVAIAENTKVSKTVREDWNNTLNSLSATDEKSYNSALDAIQKARKAVDENLSAWNTYIALANQAEQLLKDETYKDDSDDLETYIKYTYKSYIENLNITTEEVHAEIASLQDLYEEAKAEAPTGTDVTSMIINPDFSKGWDHWEHTGSGTVKADNIAKCAEAWNSANFDIHQDIENVPVGVYEVKVQGFYRYLRGNNAWNEYFNPDGIRKTDGVSDYITNTPAKIYINDNTSPMANVFDFSVAPEYAAAHWTVNDYYTDPNKKRCYPNNMTDAGEAFDRGDYQTSAIGLVAKKGDKLRIGMKGDSNQGDDSWAIFSRFKLIYKGYDEKVIKSALRKAVMEVNTDILIGSDVIAEANKAVNEGNESLKQTDSKRMFNALAAIYALNNKFADSEALFKKLTSETNNFRKVINSKSGSANSVVVTEANNLVSEITNAIANKTFTNAQATEAIKKMEEITKKLSIPASIVNMTAINPDINTIYTIDGVRVSKLQKGLNIIRTSNGVKKIVK